MRSINHADVVVESAAALVAPPELEVGFSYGAADEEEDDDDDDEPVVFWW